MIPVYTRRGLPGARLRLPQGAQHGQERFARISGCIMRFRQLCVIAEPALHGGDPRLHAAQQFRAPGADDPPVAVQQFIIGLHLPPRDAGIPLEQKVPRPQGTFIVAQRGQMFREELRSGKVQPAPPVLRPAAHQPSNAAAMPATAPFWKAVP